MSAHPQRPCHEVVAVQFAGVTWVVEAEFDEPDPEEVGINVSARGHSICHGVKIDGHWFWCDDIFACDFTEGIEAALDRMHFNREEA